MYKISFFSQLKCLKLQLSVPMIQNSPNVNWWIIYYVDMKKKPAATIFLLLNSVFTPFVFFFLDEFFLQKNIPKRQKKKKNKRIHKQQCRNWEVRKSKDIYIYSNEHHRFCKCSSPLSGNQSFQWACKTLFINGTLGTFQNFPQQPSLSSSLSRI